MPEDPVLSCADRVLVGHDQGSTGQCQGHRRRAHPGRERRRRSLLHLAHLTDAHLTDEESPLRADGIMAALGEPIVTTAHRPHAPYSLHLLDAAVRAINAARSPVTGQPAELCLFTGDAADNAQRNELAWFLQIMNGGQVDPNSGAAAFDGYQRDEELAALLAANRPFTAPGLSMPWYAIPGNHDVLALGALPITDRLNAVATGAQRVNGPPLFQPSRVPADPDRAFVRATDLPALFGHHMPVLSPSAVPLVLGHCTVRYSTVPRDRGLRAGNAEGPALYYAIDLPPSGGDARGGVRLICLDTCNRGNSYGSLDPIQFAWLEEQIAAAPDLVIVAGHHQLSSPHGLTRPDVDQSTGRVITADQVIALLARYPQVIAYLTGHGHYHRVTPHPDALTTQQPNHPFWEIETASPFDPPHQSRLIELFDNDDGALSLLCTVIEPAFPPPAGGIEGGPGLADHARAVARADPQVRHFAGTPADRDVELMLPAS